MSFHTAKPIADFLRSKKIRTFNSRHAQAHFLIYCRKVCRTYSITNKECIARFVEIKMIRGFKREM